MCGWIVFGFLAGLVARALMPGTQRMGFILTTILGVAGAFVGGFIASLLFHFPYMAFRPAGFVGAVIGSVVILALGGFGNSRRH